MKLSHFVKQKATRLPTPAEATQPTAIVPPAPPAIPGSPAPSGGAAAPRPAAEAVPRAGKTGASAAPRLSVAEGPLSVSDGARYESRPAGIYEAARQMGIVVPENPVALIERAKTCLAMVFVKILFEPAEEDVVWPMIKSIAGDIEGHAAEEMSVVTRLCRTATHKDRLLWHSLHTAILAMELAQHVPTRGCSVQDIGAAALLHDIGLLLRPDGLHALNELPEADFREHVTRGVEWAQKLRLPEPVVAMIAQHHHRLDGRPDRDGIAPEAFPPYCQILAIANVFEASVIDLTADAAPAPSADGPPRDIPQILRDYRQAFDNALLKKMIDLIGFYPIGSLVELSNSAIARVVKLNKGLPLRPIVEVLVDGDGSHPEPPRMIDLKRVPLIAIMRSVVQPVAQPEAQPDAGRATSGMKGS